jgi:hypothetical protein
MEIKQRLKKGDTHEVIAQDYGVCRATISMIYEGKSRREA